MISLDGIKYIFQIPMDWFRRVSAVCFKSYPGFLVRMNEKDDGSYEVGIDRDEFVAAVQSVGGSVASVDGVGPDANGNVTLNAIRAATDKSGYVYNTSGVISYVSAQSGDYTIDVVASITWTGTQLVATNKRLLFSNGFLTGVTNLNNTTINTVTY